MMIDAWTFEPGVLACKQVKTAQDAAVIGVAGEEGVFW
jgi:hypothetical protein